MKKILVPVDFSPASTKAAEYACELANAFNAEVQLLHVYMEPSPVGEAPTPWMIISSELQRENEALIENEVNRLKAKFSIQISGDAKVGFKGDIIRSEAKHPGVDMVVMGLKKGKRNKIFAGTTFNTVKRTKTPVLIIPEEAAFKPVRHIVLATDLEDVTEVNGWPLLYELVKYFDAGLQLLHSRKKNKALTASELNGRQQLDLVLSGVTYWYDEAEDDDTEHAIKNYIERHPADMLVMVAHEHHIFQRLLGTIHTRDIGFLVKIPLLILSEH